MNCDLSNSTTAITLPTLENGVWYGGLTYNVTWDSTLPIFSNPSYSKGVDLEVIIHNVKLNTYRWVHTYQNIKIPQSYLTLEIDEKLWNVRLDGHADYLYQLAMIPFNFKGETDARNGSMAHCIRPASVRIIPAALSPNPLSSLDEFENDGLSKMGLLSVYYVAIAVFTALAVIAYY